MLIEIDGSEGEGGGQILRSALALSILTGKPFKLVNIRANRPKPGLAAQHLMCVKAAGQISGAFYKGANIGSSVLFFEPKEVKAGTYHFSIGTAGATGLVLHTLALPLALRGNAESHLTITGGTHVKAAPTYHFNETTWAAYHRKFGMEIDLQMVRPGFYPRGGGEIQATIRPCPAVKHLKLIECPKLTTAGGFAARAELPESVSEKMARRMKHKLKQAGIESEIPHEEWSNGPSAVAAIVFRQAPVPTMFTALGERGKPSEAVADDCAEEALAYNASGCPVDPHSADQIVLPLAFADHPSEYRVSEVTQHLRTNVETIKRFVDREITCEGGLHQPGTVRIGPRDLE
jgi:RNA 3'-terminal phosphate cyclase (ATP)